jgi:hypothetical protein
MTITEIIITIIVIHTKGVVAHRQIADAAHLHTTIIIMVVVDIKTKF